MRYECCTKGCVHCVKVCVRVCLEGACVVKRYVLCKGVVCCVEDVCAM